MPPSTSEPAGDFHNFGRAVSLITVQGVSYFHKPRTTFWEHLFFGSSSPLLTLFIGSPIEDLFRLEFAPHLGPAYQLKINEVAVLDLDFHQYGFLIAYCFLFGIQDLHHQNVLRTTAGPQPIDLETAFSNLVAPCQTLLVPGPNISFKRTPLCKYIESERLSPSQAANLFLGFERGCEWIAHRTSELLSRIPIKWRSEKNRIIFRATKDYSMQIEDFFAEEEIQLRRGDIPYFFKTDLSAEVFYFLREGEAAPAKMIPENKIQVASIVGTKPHSLLDRSTIENRKWPVGTLSLAASFRESLRTMPPIKLKHGDLLCQEKFAVLEHDGRKYQINF